MLEQQKEAAGAAITKTTITITTSTTMVDKEDKRK